MKTAIKTVLLVAGLTLATGLQAQEKRGKDLTPEEKASKRTEKLTKKLGLTEEQAKQVKTLNLAHAQKMEGLKADKKALKERAKSERDAHHKAIEKTLTPEQQAKFTELKEKHRVKRQKRRAKRMEQMKEEHQD